jgi:hypothetical protein
MPAKRTARKDSNYVIYEMTSATGLRYIGLTRKGTRTARGAVLERWRRHLSRARCELRAWTLYEYLREEGLELEWQYRVLEVVRGRLEAYQQERQIVLAEQPELNSQYSG